MNWAGCIAVGSGAVLGALLRWWLSLRLNLFTGLPLGTLSANLIGGYVIGVAIGFASTSGLPPHVRLFVMTGFCGGLTTFSTFSAETVGLLLGGRFGWSAAMVAAHVLGSFAATAFGIFSVRLLRS